MVAIVIIMFLLFAIIGILSVTMPYATPELDNMSNYDRIRFGAFREGFVDPNRQLRNF